MIKKSVLRNIFVGLFVVYLIVNTAFAQTTAFNYQGKLTDTGAAQSTYQMQFALFDAATGGTQIGGIIANPAVAVNQGVFSVTLDFGASPFTGVDRFLQISVRRSAAEAYTVLSPREKIASSPYSIRTLSAAQADIALDSNKLGGLDANQYVTTATVGNSFIKNSTTPQTANFNITGSGFVGGNFGLGTTTTTAKLQILSPPGITGIFSESTSGRAVWGKSLTSRGVYGESETLEGVFGVSNSGAGVSGNSTSGIGVFGQTGAANSITKTGVYGLSTGSGGVGVTGESNTGNAIGVFGVSTSPTGFGMYARNNFGGRAIYAEGNVAQNVNDNGLVKAMIVVNDNGQIARCYNGVTNSSSGNCGFIITQPLGFVGVYRINFGFAVTGRFVAVTTRYLATTANVNNGGANYREFDSTSIEIFTFISGDSADTSPHSFTIILF